MSRRMVDLRPMFQPVRSTGTPVTARVTIQTTTEELQFLRGQLLTREEMEVILHSLSSSFCPHEESVRTRIFSRLILMLHELERYERETSSVCGRVF